MKREKGSILAVVLIVMVALYLLAGIMFVINRQYFSDTEIMQDSKINRQKLLDASYYFMGQLVEIDVEDKLLQWDDCSLQSQPDYLWDEDLKLYYQIAQLSNFCNGDGLLVRLWLKSLDNEDDRLIVDILSAYDGWKRNIDNDRLMANLMRRDNSWIILFNNAVFSKEFVLMESENLPILRSQLVRVHKEHYELILVFEDSEKHVLEFYHLSVPIAELHFDINMIFHYQVSTANKEDGDELLVVNTNDIGSVNWRISLEDKLFDSLSIQNNVIFISLHQFNDKLNKSIVGMYLMGLPFFGDNLLGYERGMLEDVVQLISCNNVNKLLIEDQWEIGCLKNKKVRYYFSE